MVHSLSSIPLCNGKRKQDREQSAVTQPRTECICVTALFQESEFAVPLFDEYLYLLAATFDVHL